MRQAAVAPETLPSAIKARLLANYHETSMSVLPVGVDNCLCSFVVMLKAVFAYVNRQATDKIVHTAIKMWKAVVAAL